MILSRFIYPAFAAIFVIGPVANGLAQTGGASGARGSNSGPAAASTVGTGAQSVTPDNASDVVGSGGSAAAGDTSASSLGLGAYSTAPTGTSSTLGTGGSAATPSGHATSRSGIHGNRNLSGQSMNQAHDPGGVWSKSHTQTHVRQGDLTSRTKSMAHQPGGPPVKSTTDSSVDVGR